jgi:hypothetical protein
MVSIRCASFRPTTRVAIDGCPFKEPDLWLVGTVGRMETVKDQTNLAAAFVAAVRARRRGPAGVCGS